MFSADWGPAVALHWYCSSVPWSFTLNSALFHLLSISALLCFPPELLSGIAQVQLDATVTVTAAITREEAILPLLMLPATVTSRTATALLMMSLPLLSCGTCHSHCCCYHTAPSSSAASSLPRLLHGSMAAVADATTFMAADCCRCFRSTIAMAKAAGCSLGCTVSAVWLSATPVTRLLL